MLSADEEWQCFAEIDKTKSHQGAAVVTIPPYKDQTITSPVTVNIEVRSASERDPRTSDPVEFTYNPEEKKNSSLELCTSCSSILENQGGLLGQMLAKASNIISNSVTPMEFSTADAGTMEVDVSVQNGSAERETPEEQEWQSLCTEVRGLFESGDINQDQLKVLNKFIQVRDTLLLQSYRSSKSAGSSTDFKTRFKQYLAGLLLTA